MTTATPLSQANYGDRELANAKYKRHVSSDERTDGGPGFWLICDRPFDQAATDMLRSATQACKPVPSVIGNARRRRTLATAP